MPPCLCSSSNSALFQRCQFHLPIWSEVNHCVWKPGSNLPPILDQHEFEILAGVVLAIGPVGAAVERVDLHVDADLGEVRLHDRGRRLRDRR